MRIDFLRVIGFSGRPSMGWSHSNPITLRKFHISATNIVKNPCRSVCKYYKKEKALLDSKNNIRNPFMMTIHTHYPERKVVILNCENDTNRITFAAISWKINPYATFLHYDDLDIQPLPPPSDGKTIIK